MNRTAKSPNPLELIEAFNGIVGYSTVEEQERGRLVRELLKLLPVDEGLDRTARLLGISIEGSTRYAGVRD